MAKYSSDWEKIEASYCQIASDDYTNWTRIHQDDFKVDKRQVVIGICHFTRFGLFGIPRGRARKTMLVSCFGRDLRSNPSTYFRVWLCDGTEVAFQVRLIN